MAQSSAIEEIMARELGDVDIEAIRARTTPIKTPARSAGRSRTDVERLASPSMYPQQQLPDPAMTVAFPLTNLLPLVIGLGIGVVVALSLASLLSKPAATVAKSATTNASMGLTRAEVLDLLGKASS